jgi:translocation and assembly module TamB
MTEKTKKTTLRILAGLFLGVCLLFLSVYIFLNSLTGQKTLGNWVFSKLSEQIKAPVSGEVSYSIPDWVNIKNLKVLDEQKDTLLFAQKLKVDLDLWKLLDNKIEINQVDLSGAYVNIYDKNNKPNYQFIIDAFASEPDTTATPFTYQLRNIKIQNLRAKYANSKAGHAILANLKDLQTGFDVFDLDKLKFVLKPANVNGLTVNGTIGGSTADTSQVTKVEESSSLDFKFSELDLKNVNWRLAMPVLKKNTQGQNLNASLSAKDIDLPKGNFELSKFSINAKSISYQTQSLTNKTPGVFNADDIAFHDFEGTFSKILVSKDNLSLLVDNLTAKEQSGFELQDLSTEVKKVGSQVSVKNFVANTPKSTLSFEAETVLNEKDIANSTFDLNLQKAKLGLNELLFFDKKIFENPYLKNLKGQNILANGKISGSSKRVNLEKVNVLAPQNTNLSLSGSVANFSEPIFDLTIQNFSSSRKDILSIVPKDQLPENINLPNTIALNGTVKGKVEDLNLNLKLRSDFGNAGVVANLKGFTGNKKPAYVGQVSIDNFDFGKTLGDTSLGKTTGHLDFNGSGLALDQINAHLSGELAKVYYQGKTYEQISVDGQLKDQIFKTQLDINDPAAKVTWKGDIDLRNPTLAISGDTKVSFLDLKKMGFVTQDIQIQGDLDLRTLELDPKNPKIDLNGKNINVYVDKKMYALGDLYLKSLNTENKKQLRLETAFAKISLDGNFEYDQLQEVIMTEINKYFKLPGFTPKIAQRDYNMQVVGNVTYDPIFTALVPGIINFEPIHVVTVLRSDGEVPLAGNITIPYMLYDSIQIENTSLDFSGDSKSLDYQLSTDRLSNSSFRLRNASLVGNLENNIAYFDLSVRDTTAQVIHALRGNVASINEDLRLSFDEDGMQLFYEQWAGNPYGFIDYGPKGVLFNNVVFTSGNQILRINSIDAEPNGPIRLFTKGIDINYLTTAILQDSTLYGGVLNSDLVLSDILEETPSVSGDINIDDLKVNQIYLGGFKGNTQTDKLGNITLNATLFGPSADVKLNGNYNQNKKDALDFVLDITELHVKALQPYMEDILGNLDGKVNGSLVIKGAADSPNINGFMALDTLSFKVLQTGAKMGVKNQKIKFDNQKVLFDKFELKDINNQKLVMNGEVDINHLPDFSYDFDINTKEFNLIDSKKDETELFYGKGYFDAKLNLKGKGMDFFLTGDINIKDRTNLTLLLEDESQAASELESIVDFVSFKNNDKEGAVKAKKKESGINFSNAVNLNIDVPEEAQLNILMDPVTGDLMTVKGRGKLNVGFDNNGDLFILGKYDIVDGSYNLTYQIIQKKFLINENSKSYISWSGDPMNADLSISAEYKLGRKALDKYPFDATVSELKDAKFNIPLEVDLVVSGILSSPVINFQLVVNEDDIGSYSKQFQSQGFAVKDSKGIKTLGSTSKDKEEKIKDQAIIMLVTGAFSPESLISNITSAESYENLARKTASDLITSQLNRYAGGIIKGIDLNLGLQSGYNSTNDSRNTNLNLGVSKKLANDRLIISVGKNFELENKDLRSDEIFDNITANWIITKDGRYRLNIFRKNLNQMVIEGSVVETGLGFVIAIDYETWKELLKRK